MSNQLKSIPRAFIQALRINNFPGAEEVFNYITDAEQFIRNEKGQTMFSLALDKFEEYSEPDENGKWHYIKVKDIEDNVLAEWGRMYARHWYGSYLKCLKSPAICLIDKEDVKAAKKVVNSWLRRMEKNGYSSDPISNDEWNDYYHSNFKEKQAFGHQLLFG